MLEEGGVDARASGRFLEHRSREREGVGEGLVVVSTGVEEDGEVAKQVSKGLMMMLCARGSEERRRGGGLELQDDIGLFGRAGGREDWGLVRGGDRVGESCGDGTMLSSCVRGIGSYGVGASEGAVGFSVS
jgi:hypothetical protein